LSGEHVSRAFALVARHRLIALGGLLVLGALSWAGYLWGRDLSLFEVRKVEIRGVSGREAPDIRRALRSAAGRMTTLHVKEELLDEAVDSFQAVRSVSASADFPNSMKIEVVEWRPVAVLLSRDGRRVAVAGEGTLLRGVGAGARLPVVRVSEIPHSGELEERPALGLVRLLGEAPEQLTRLLARAYVGEHGMDVETREGTTIQFANDARARAKWAAAASVIADPSSRGAEVIDVRVPERPAARDQDGGTTGTPTATAAAAPALVAAAPAAATGPAGPTGATEAP
jgi:cell division septal protein FtsQ